MIVLGVILARAGSKGLPDKCVRALLGRKVIEYTFDHAKASKLLTGIAFSTDSETAKAIAQVAGIEVIDRPAELACDTATVDAAARHAVLVWEKKHHSSVDGVALLYGNIPVRAEGLVDRAIEHLIRSGADSIRSVAPVTKQHPDWVHRLDGDRMTQYRPNSIYRRQDLSPLYYHDGAIAVVTRAALFGALDTPDDHQSFLGRDRRAIVCKPEEAVDIDEVIDLYVAEAVLRRQAKCRLSNVDCRMQLAGRDVGARMPVFIIAEAGVNHNGCVETALRMVDAAAEAGADAVKFQIFRAAELTTADAATAEYQRQRSGEKSQRTLLSRLELRAGDFERIKQRCEQLEVVFLATPFGERELSLAVELGVAAIKIASTDLTNGPLLDAAAATGLPLILSTGASTAQEIDEAVDALTRGGVLERLILMHCVSCYPTPVASANLRAMGELRRRFGVPVGLSDHTTAVETGGWAVAAGACVLEKHFTLDRAMPGPDQSMSLTPPELQEYIGQVRKVESALGSGGLGMTDLEAGVRAVARKSVVAMMAIEAGTRLTQSMLTLKRPGTGLPPQALATLIGRQAARDIPSDTLLSWDMVR